MGRTRDVLHTAAGTVITPEGAVAAADPGTNSIVDFQVVLNSDRSLDIFVVQRDATSEAADREWIASVFEPLVLPPHAPRVQRVPNTALTQGGKLRTLISAF